ncbi:MAG: EF-hand domain-containing protein [Hyphomicrobiales bacterium]|nr:EF-hand domain-containing protein [Hyphomicrobiales bacterium]
MTTRFLSAAAALAFAGLAAMPAARAMDISASQWAEVQKRFAAADKDHDGSLTLAEAKAGMPRVAKNFDMIDRGKKGYVTLDDIKAAMTAQ